MCEGERGVIPGSPMLFAGEGSAIASVHEDSKGFIMQSYDAVHFLLSIYIKLHAVVSFLKHVFI